MDTRGRSRSRSRSRGRGGNSNGNMSNANAGSEYFKDPITLERVLRKNGVALNGKMYDPHALLQAFKIARAAKVPMTRRNLAPAEVNAVSRGAGYRDYADFLNPRDATFDSFWQRRPDRMLNADPAPRRARSHWDPTRRARSPVAARRARSPVATRRARSPVAARRAAPQNQSSPVVYFRRHTSAGNKYYRVRHRINAAGDPQVDLYTRLRNQWVPDSSAIRGWFADRILGPTPSAVYFCTDYAPPGDGSWVKVRAQNKEQWQRREALQFTDALQSQLPARVAHLAEHLA